MSKRVVVKQVSVFVDGSTKAMCEVVNEGPASPLHGPAAFEIFVNPEGGYGPNEAAFVSEIAPLARDLVEAVRRLGVEVIKGVS